MGAKRPHVGKSCAGLAAARPPATGREDRSCDPQERHGVSRSLESIKPPLPPPPLGEQGQLPKTTKNRNTTHRDTACGAACVAVPPTHASAALARLEPNHGKSSCVIDSRANTVHQLRQLVGTGQGPRACIHGSTSPSGRPITSKSSRAPITTR